jgi:hypothetical protein
MQFVTSENCASNTIQKNISHAVNWRLCRNWQLLRGYAAWCDINTLQVHILAGQQLSSTYKTPTTCERLVGYYHIFIGAVYIFSCSVFILLSLPRRCQPPSPQPPVVHAPSRALPFNHGQPQSEVVLVLHLRTVITAQRV